MFDRKNHRVFWLGGLVLVLVAIAAVNMEGQNAVTAKSQSANGVGRAEDIRIRGHLTCLAEAMHDLYRADLPVNHENTGNSPNALALGQTA